MRWLSLFLLLPSLTLAIPKRLHQEGLLADAQGAPHEGAAQLRFSFYGEAEGGAALWFEEHNLNLSGGYYSVILGAQTAFGAVLDTDPRFLGVAVDGVELLPRVQLSSVPYALMAENVVGEISPRSIYVGGRQVIDEGGNWVGPQVPGAGDGVGYNTPAEALAAVKTLDGAGSGLDADTLDGLSSAAFLQNGEQVMALLIAADGSGSGLDADRLDGHDSSAFIRTAAQLIELLLSTDGTGTGLDADRLDGHDSSEFINTTDPATAAQLLSLLLEVDGADSGLDADLLDGHDSTLFMRAADPATAAQILNLLLTVDGAGTGLDADTLDGLHASKFMRVDQDTGTSGQLSLGGLLSGVDAHFTGTLVADQIEANRIHANLIRLVPQALPPEDPQRGSMYFDDPSGEVKLFDGDAWNSLSAVVENGAVSVANILTSDKMNIFNFSNSHGDGFAGDPKYVSDEVDREVTTSWSSYGFQHRIGAGDGWWKVDLLEQYRARHIVVVGYANGSHYPNQWRLEGSNDNSNWFNLHDFVPSPNGSSPPPDWHLHGGTGADGKSWNDVKERNSGDWVEISRPGNYRYYRIIGNGWNISNGYMLLMNVGLFVDVNMHGTSCKDILARGNSSGDGVYWIDPDGSGVGMEAIQVYCDMTTDNGGWTRVANVRAEIPICAYNVALGTNLDLINDTANTGLMGPNSVNAITGSSTLDAVMVKLDDGNYYIYRSDDAAFTWNNVATMYSLGIENYGVRGSKNGGVYTILRNSGCSSPGCLMGGSDSTLGNWSTILGIGGHARGAAIQDADCLSGSNGWLGLYSGMVGNSTLNWGQQGKVYVR